MGRGRAKAKQTKVARELKYGTVNTDLTALQRELAGAPASPLPTTRAPAADDAEDEDPYADVYADDDSDEPGPARAAR